MLYQCEERTCFLVYTKFTVIKKFKDQIYFSRRLQFIFVTGRTNLIQQKQSMPYYMSNLLTVWCFPLSIEYQIVPKVTNRRSYRNLNKRTWLCQYHGDILF